jgi:hypothetical protein
VSPFSSSGFSFAIVSSTGLPAGTISQIARGALSFFARSSSVFTPVDPASVSRCTASAL